MMVSLDQKIVTVMDELEELRTKRSILKCTHNLLMREAHKRLSAVNEATLRLLKTKKDRRFYKKIIEGTYDTPTGVPARYVLDQQAMLLCHSHVTEYLHNHVERTREGNKQLSQYMMCEISVVEDEGEKIKTRLSVQVAQLKSDFEVLEGKRNTLYRAKLIKTPSSNRRAFLFRALTPSSFLKRSSKSFDRTSFSKSDSELPPAPPLVTASISCE